MTECKYHTIQKVLDPIISRNVRGDRNSELNSKSFHIFRLTGSEVRGPEFSSVSAAPLLCTWANYIVSPFLSL